MDRNRKMVTLLIFALLIGSQVFAAGGLINLTFDKTTYVGGVKIERGACLVTWKAKMPEAEVTFSRGGKKLVTVTGKFIEGETKSNYDSYMAVRDGNGNDVIKEIHFQGKKSVLQFD
jgi:hypothetical protein